MSFKSLSLVLACLSALAACGKKEAEEAEEGREHAQAANPLIAMQPEEAREDPRAQIFLTKGCPQCHAMSALRITSPTNVGPDLSTAYDDVKQRFNVPLEQFLHNPTGTMQIVLSGQIQLSSAERDSMIGLLRNLATHRP